VPQNHFWAGSACLVNELSNAYPSDVIAISDILTLKDDVGNQIPNKSWMIYMLELFVDKNYIQENQVRSVPLELDLFCQFDDKIDFKAVFNGHNQYSFKTVLPKIAHSYQREIILNASKRNVMYRLRDINSGESESFELSATNMNGSVSDQKKMDLIKVMNDVKFESYKHFTGVEWWNNVDNVPYPVRYHVQFSMLRYAQSHDSSPELEKLSYKPYTSLAGDTDSLGKQYPISFHDLREMDGCICYDIASGKTNTGMEYSL
jgi:hypothetical protein